MQDERRQSSHSAPYHITQIPPPLQAENGRKPQNSEKSPIRTPTIGKKCRIVPLILQKYHPAPSTHGRQKAATTRASRKGRGNNQTFKTFLDNLNFSHALQHATLSPMNKAPDFAPFLTTEYLQTADENKLFDRKSKNVKPAALAELISAFANADGGTIVIGANDDKEFEGIDTLSAERFNQLINAPKDFCRPTPAFSYELKPITNNKGKPDHLLLLHIENETERIIQTQNESVYLRIGDRTKELKGEDLRLLEYNRGQRSYEDEWVEEAGLEDLDHDLLNEYKSKINANNLPDAQVLRARGLMKRKGQKWYLTRGALLLFAQEIIQFHPNCRVRFTRYEGTTQGVGSQLNIIKDVNFDLPILKLIPATTQFIASQLKELTRLNPSTGRFETSTEYPEFAWTEALINAIAHREYALEGAFIQISMFDDRLEISSPGRLPNIVTIDNIQYTRYSRNPHLTRVLIDFGWVRELNEGVKRIYAEMRESNLAEPRYSEPDRRYVLITLTNKITRPTESINTQDRKSVV